MERGKIYLIAAIFSLLFYFFGIISGLFIERSMTDLMEEKVKSLQRELENLQLEYAYLSIIGKDMPCDSLSSLVHETNQKVRNLGGRLNEKEPKFEELRRDYALLSIKAWILNNYVKEKCKDDFVVVLYFYSVPCNDCIKQGKILDELRDKKFNERLLVFVLNADLNEPIVNTLKTVYQIRKTPSLVIGEETYSGLVNEENLTEILSKRLR